MRKTPTSEQISPRTLVLRAGEDKRRSQSRDCRQAQWGWALGERGGQGPTLTPMGPLCGALSPCPLSIWRVAPGDQPQSCGQVGLPTVPSAWRPCPCTPSRLHQAPRVAPPHQRIHQAAGVAANLLLF